MTEVEEMVELAELTMAARRQKYVAQLVEDALSPDDVLALVALEEINWILQGAAEEGYE